MFFDSSERPAILVHVATYYFHSTVKTFSRLEKHITAELEKFRLYNLIVFSFW